MVIPFGKYLTVVEEQLEEMQNDEGREESIQMDIKAVAPLDIFCQTTRWLDQVFVAYHL